MVSIIYLCYNDEPYKYLERMIAGVKKQINKDNLRLIIVYNPGSTNKTKVIDFIRTKIAINKAELPPTVFLPQTKNIGFVGGNNKGIEWVLDKPQHGSEYIFLHNGDGFLDKDVIAKMTIAMDADNKIGCAQAMVLMYPNSSQINTSGNKINFLGLSYCGDYKLSYDLYQKPVNDTVAFASGSAMMLRVDLLRQYGMLDRDFFIYLEDMEYCLRLNTLGYKTIIVPDAIFFHQYEFNNKPTKYYYLERNRGIILLSYYKLLTLLLIFPAWCIMELGICFFALTNGWGKEKLREYTFWFKKSSWILVKNKRQTIQNNRKINDRELLSIMTDKIIFEDVDHWLLKYIANPFLQIYWKIVYWIIRW